MNGNRILTLKETRWLVQIVIEGYSIWRENIKKIQEEYNITEEGLTWGKDELKKRIREYAYIWNEYEKGSCIVLGTQSEGEKYFHVVVERPTCLLRQCSETAEASRCVSPCRWVLSTGFRLFVRDNPLLEVLLYWLTRKLRRTIFKLLSNGWLPGIVGFSAYVDDIFYEADDNHLTRSWHVLRHYLLCRW